MQQDITPDVFLNELGQMFTARCLCSLFMFLMLSILTLSVSMGCTYLFIVLYAGCIVLFGILLVGK